MIISILPEAEDDIADAYRFYEIENAGVGAYFLQCIFADIDALLITGPIHEIRFGKHRKVASKFPYSIFYFADANQINIVAVLDDRRDPKWISDRLN